jgi:hypothetical protein
MENEMGNATLNMTIHVGSDRVDLPQAKANSPAAFVKGALAQKLGVPVLVDPVLRVNEMGDAHLGMNITVGPDKIELAKKTVPVSSSLA